MVISEVKKAMKGKSGPELFYEIEEGGSTYLIKHEIRQIDASEAQRLLDTNDNNRKPTKANLERINRSHLKDHWKYLGDTVKIDEVGLLRDGQHRLLAIVESGAKIPQLVISGLPREYFKYMDINKGRTATDMFKIQRVKNPAGVKGAMQFLWQLLYVPSVKVGRWSGITLPTPPESSDLFELFHDDAGQMHGENVFDSHVVRGQTAAKKAYLRSDCVSVMSFLYDHIDPALSASFWEGVIEGVGLKVKDPRKALREYAKQKRDAKISKKKASTSFFGSHSNPSPFEIATWIQLAWNRWVEGKEVTNFAPHTQDVVLIADIIGLAKQIIEKEQIGEG